MKIRHRHSARTALRGALGSATGALALALASCSSGADVDASGAGPVVPPISFLEPDFDLRRDVLLDPDGASSLGDAKAADLDGDGLTDLVESEFVERRITFGQGDGLGNYGPPDAYSTPGAPHKMALGDYDGDGRTDIAVACKKAELGQTVELMNSVALFLQTGDAVFTLASVYDLNPGDVVPDVYDPFDLASAPFRGGNDELVVTLPGSRQVLWLAYDGAELGLVQTLETDARPLTVTAADMNGDGLRDIVVGEDKVPDSVFGRVAFFPVLPDVGESALLPQVGVPDMGPIRVPGIVVSVPVVSSFGDTNGDGRDEVGVADFGGRFLSVVQPGELGTFEVLHSIDFEDGIFAALAADLDADGRTDFAASLAYQGAVTVARGVEGGFEPLQHYSVGYLPRAIAAIQLGDPNDTETPLDLVTCNADDISLLQGRRVEDADGASVASWRAARGYKATEGFEPRLVRVADLDGDGVNDVVAVDRLQRELVFFTGDGSGGLEYAGSSALAESTTETPGYVELHDLDDDGDLDLVTSIMEKNEVAVFLNDGVLPLQAQTRVMVGDEPRGFSLADLDDDGDLDAIVAVHGDGALQVLLGDGDGGFEAGATYAVPAAPLAVLLEDLDGDGRIDCLVSTGTPGMNDARLVAFAGRGDGTLAPEPASQRDLEAQALVLRTGDFDEDGDEDVAAAQVGEFSTAVFVFLNDGDFQFTEREVSVGDERAGPGTLEVADVDLDGNLDLLVPLAVGELQVVLGMGDGTFERLDASPRARELSLPFGTQTSAWADMDGDGLGDLVLASKRTSHIWIARNTSQATGEGGVQ